MSTSNTPLTFDDAVKSILNDLTDKDREYVLENSEKCILANTHSTMGRAMRNDWGLWADSPLKQDMEKLGFTHADDMSGAIITSAVRTIKGEDVRLQEQVDKYKAYWKRYK